MMFNLGTRGPLKLTHIVSCVKTHGEEGHVKTEAETRVVQLQSWNTRECQEAAEGGGGGRTSSLETSESVVLPTPWFQTSSPQNCQRIDFCCFKTPELWCFVRAETNVKKPTQRGSSSSMPAASLSRAAEPPLVPIWPLLSTTPLKLQDPVRTVMSPIIFGAPATLMTEPWYVSFESKLLNYPPHYTRTEFYLLWASS